MPRRTASSARSEHVQCVKGSPVSSGFSQASARMAAICSGLKVGGRPDATLPRSTVWMAAARALGSSKHAFQPARASSQRERTSRATFGCAPTASAASGLVRPSAMARTKRARRACRCGVLAPRTSRSRSARSAGARGSSVANKVVMTLVYARNLVYYLLPTSKGTTSKTLN